MIKPTNSELAEYFKTFCGHIGLSKGDVEVVSSTTEHCLYLRWGIKLNYSKLEFTPLEFYNKTFEPIVKDIENSEAVKNSLYELDKENKSLTVELNLANEEIKRIKEFETYYNMHFKMNHGKNNES